MKGLAPIIMALALLWPTGTRAETSQCLRSTIKIGTLPDGRILVPISVEGHKLWFLLDTGGVATTIKWELVKQLGLPVKQSETALRGVGGSRLSFYTAADDILLGDLRLKARPIYVESRNLPFADGTLAADMLRDYDVEVDLANGKLSLSAPDSCAESAAAVIAMDVGRDGHVRFPVKLDGKTIIATFDTGSAVSLMPMNAAALLGVYPTSSALGPGGNIGQYPVYTYPFNSLEFGGVSVKNPHIMIVGDRLIPDTGSVLVLGMDAFQQMHFSIRYGENRFLILPDAHPAPEPASDAGHPLATPP